MDPNYVTGFSDAASSFTYSRSGRQIAVYYAVKCSDRSILEDLQAFFGGAGTIYDANGAYYRVSHRDDLGVVVDHFDAYPLRTKKRLAYPIWRTMVMMKREFRRPNRDLLNTLADELSLARA